MEKVIEILGKMKPGIDFEKENDLLGKGILSSLDIMMLVASLNDAYDIEIPLKYVKPQYFSSAEKISEMVDKVLEDE